MITKFRIRSIVFPVFLGILICGVIGFLIISSWRISQKRAELKIKAEQLQKEIQFLQERKEQLEAGVSRIGQEEYLEEKIRDQGYKKPGEEAIVIKKEQEEEKKTEAEQSFWEKIFNIFQRD